MRVAILHLHRMGFEYHGRLVAREETEEASFVGANQFMRFRGIHLWRTLVTVFWLKTKTSCRKSYQRIT